MPLPRDFDKMLAQKTDEELYEMMARAADYTPEALEAAHVEIGHRNLDPTRSAQLEAHSQEVIASIKAPIARRATFAVVGTVVVASLVALFISDWLQDNVVRQIGAMALRSDGLAHLLGAGYLILDAAVPFILLAAAISCASCAGANKTGPSDVANLRCKSPALIYSRQNASFCRG